MGEYKIKYSKKFVNEGVVAGGIMSIVSIALFLFVEAFAYKLLFAVGLALGVFLMSKTIKFFLNGRVFATIGNDILKFHNGRVIPLEEIDHLMTGATGTGSSYRTELFIVTVSGVKVLVANNKDYEDKLNVIENNIVRVLNNRTKESKIYTDDVVVKFSKGYILLTRVIYIALAIVIGYGFSQEILNGKYTLVVNIVLVNIIVVYTYFRYVFNSFINVVITNEDIVLRSGRKIPLEDIYHISIEKMTARKVRRGNIETTTLKERRNLDKVFDRVLVVKTKGGENYRILCSTNSDISPEEVENIIYAKIKRLNL